MDTITKLEPGNLLSCPYCKKPMSKLWENSKRWHCENCNTVFEEGSIINKI